MSSRSRSQWSRSLWRFRSLKVPVCSQIWYGVALLWARVLCEKVSVLSERWWSQWRLKSWVCPFCALNHGAFYCQTSNVSVSSFEGMPYIKVIIIKGQGHSFWILQNDYCIFWPHCILWTIEPAFRKLHLLMCYCHTNWLAKHLGCHQQGQGQRVWILQACMSNICFFWSAEPSCETNLICWYIIGRQNVIMHKV